MIIKAVDLFCGIGGLTCGLEKAGIPVVAGIDIDGKCEYAYSTNNNSKFIQKSIDKVKVSEINNLLHGADLRILVGCAPCQPFSSHQKDKHNRSKHKDWKLLYQFGRLVKGVKPDIVSMENVPEIVKERVFEDFVKTLIACGYHVNYQVVNVADYGVPQRRRRLILLASNGDEVKLLNPTHKNHHVTVGDVIKSLPAIAAGCQNELDPLHVTSSLTEVNLKRIQASIPGGTWHDWPDELMLDCHRGKSGKTYSAVYGRMKWDDLAPTITTQFTSYGTGRFGHPEQNRALTLREGAILQSFPFDYEFIEKKQKVVLKQISRQIGNAVPPRLGEVIGLSIIQSINLKKETKYKQS